MIPQALEIFSARLARSALVVLPAPTLRVRVEHRPGVHFALVLPVLSHGELMELLVVISPVLPAYLVTRPCLLRLVRVHYKINKPF